MSEYTHADTNLNEMLNDDDSVDTVENQTPSNSEIDENIVSDEVESPQLNNEPSWQSLFDYITSHNDKLINASLTNISGFSRVPTGKYMLFVSNDETDANLILFDRPNTMWVDSNIIPDSIKVENSGFVIKAPNSRLYVSKNNITNMSIVDDQVVQFSTVSRAKDVDSIKVVTNSDGREDTSVDTIKLHVKRISPRLYNAVKDLTTHQEIKSEIVEFMNSIHDLNHLIKIEKELLYSLGL